MSDMKFYVDINLQDNEVVKLKADTLDITTNLASANTKRIVYWAGDYYYSDGTNWVQMSGGNPVTSVTATTPLSSTGGATPDISISQANTTTDGYLSSTDWNTFNGKQNALGYTPVNLAGDIMLGYLILNADPTNPLGAATKQYVDNITVGLNFHSPVRVATAAPLPTVIYAAGPDPLNPGVSATLTATVNGALIIDGEDFSLLPVPATPYRVLIKDQASGFENGIYTVTVAGDSLTPFQLTRATDADNSPTGELSYGDFCFVETGIVNGGLGYILNTVGPITVGVTPISYVTFNAAQVVTAGYGLQELTPNVLSIDASVVLTNATAALTYLTIASASSIYVPYTGATADVDLGSHDLTANKVNISTFGDISTSGTDLILQASATKNLVFNTPNVTTGASTKIQFGGSDLITLKGLASTATVTNFRYTNPNNTNQQGPVSSMIIDPGTRTWDYTNVPNGPVDVQKEIEILSPNYTDNNPGPPSTWDGLAVTLYVNPPVTNTTGVGYGLGIKGHFLMDGDAVDYPGGTYMNIGNGDGTMIGFNGAKLSFFGNPPISKPAAVTTVQDLSTALSNLGLISVSTLSFGTTGSVLFAGASGALSQDNANFFWDDTNNRLGIGTATPSQSLDIIGKILIRDNSAITPLNYDLEVHKTVNGEVSGWIRNNSAGNAAFAQVGTRVDSSTQFKMGIYSSGFTTSGLITAGTAYLLSAGTNASKILIGNQTASKDIIFVNGGTAAANEIFRISSTNTIDIYDARNLTFGTTTGTKFGTATSQKIGFFNATPIVQPAAVTTVQGIADALTSLGLLASSSIGSPAPNVQTVASAATVTPTSANDEVTITAQAVGLTLANPTGTPSEGQALTIRIKDNGTSQTIAYGSQYRALGVTLPTTTTVSKTLYLGLIYNSTDTKWDVVGVSLEGADPFTGNDWVDYSGSSIVTGWSTTPTKVIRYRVVGKQVFFNVNISGTSNSTSASFTLPFTSLRQVDVAGYGINNTVGGIVALCEIPSSTSTANAYNGVGAWTASGTKSINFQFFIEIA